MIQPVVRWETKGKKYWYEIHQTEHGYSIRGPKSGTACGNMTLKVVEAVVEKTIAEEKVIDNRNYKRIV